MAYKNTKGVSFFKIPGAGCFSPKNQIECDPINYLKDLKCFPDFYLDTKGACRCRKGTKWRKGDFIRLENSCEQDLSPSLCFEPLGGEKPTVYIDPATN